MECIIWSGQMSLVSANNDHLFRLIEPTGMAGPRWE